MREDSTLPPLTGWKFMYVSWVNDGHNGQHGHCGHCCKGVKFARDENLTCTIPPVSPPCSVELRLNGLAKGFQEKCEGKYKDTGLRSMGRQVIFNNKVFCYFN